MNPNFLYYIGLECSNEDNKTFIIAWTAKNGQIEQLTNENTIIRIGGSNIQIDIENSTKIFNIIKDRKVQLSETDLITFKATITPEILSNI